MAKYWPADVHLIGKDVVRFHAVYWPAFLMSAGLALPKCVFGHGFLLNRGEKMSKSVGNVVDPVEMVATYGVDRLRYFLLREVSFGQDGTYSHEAIVTRTNADLANGLGNLAQRCLSIIAKSCGGVVPAAGEASPLAAILDGIAARVDEAMAALALNRALEIVWEGVGEANRHFAELAPWALRKTDPARADAVLHETADAVRPARDPGPLGDPHERGPAARPAGAGPGCAGLGGVRCPAGDRNGVTRACGSVSAAGGVSHDWEGGSRLFVRPHHPLLNV